MINLPSPLQAENPYKQPSLGGICLSFFLSAGELQAPCTKENEFPESVRQHQAEGFSPHRTNTPMVPWCCLAALLPPQHQGSMATAFLRASFKQQE